MPATSKSRVFGWAGRALACLLAGLGVSLLVAYGVAIRQYTRHLGTVATITMPATHYRLDARVTPLPATVTKSVVFGHETWLVEPERQHVLGPGVAVVSVLAPPLEPVDPPRWVPAERVTPDLGVGASGYGWPLRCVKFEQDRSTTVGPGGVVTTSMKSRGCTHVWRDSRGSAVVVAYLPIWAGLAGDTLIYGAIAGGIASLPWLRRRVRERRGLCPRCAYSLSDLAATGCPECGWNRGAANSTR